MHQRQFQHVKMRNLLGELFMIYEELIEKRVAREILTMIEKIYFSEEYKEYRISYGSNGTRDLLIDSIKKLYNVG